ncbi:MAG: DNA-processing protein DprA [Pseudomonadota bacterium]
MAKDSDIPSTHPLTPPLTEEAWLDWFRLLRSRRVGVATFHRLMGEYGTAAAALGALPGIARDAGVENYAPCPRAVVDRELAAGDRAGARPLAFGDPAYPALLSVIPDPPPILWTIGNRELLNRPLTALVGARNASSLGTRMARKLAGELGEAGHVVVSGLARGIDTAAHLASLPKGTIAVMPGGIDVITPAENAVLAQEIGEQGLLIAEAPMHTDPRPGHFLQRNRIISGLCPALIVVEAAAKSGSHSVASTALDQGRDVLAVPGHPFDARSAGSNMLIRDGATLIRHAGDLFEALGPGDDALEPPPETRSPPDPPPPTKDTKALHAEILARLGHAPEDEDSLIRALPAPPGRVSSELVALELDGRIRRDARNRFALGSSA